MRLGWESFSKGDTKLQMRRQRDAVKVHQLLTSEDWRWGGGVISYITGLLNNDCTR